MTWTTIPTGVWVAVAAVAGFLLGGTVAGVVLAGLTASRGAPDRLVVDFRYAPVE